MSKLKGRVAVITGGTEGIGLATAKLFVKEGAYVFITGRRPKELGEAVKAIGDNAAGVQGDVSNLADLDRLYETITKAKRRIDIVFANAGLSLFAPFGKVTEEHFDKLFDINVKGTGDELPPSHPLPSATLGPRQTQPEGYHAASWRYWVLERGPRARGQ
jgi:NAD(P)-dependent dehydrogenase (short-subunit alcohol dehydrogenase family)